MMTRPISPSNIVQKRNLESRSGAVLFFVVVMLGMVSLLAFTSFMLTKIDFRLALNNVREFRSFMNADAGVQYVKNQIENQLSAGITLETLASSGTVGIRHLG